MKLFIEPNDVLFFRDGKPFDAGGDHTARLQFPPNPVTFYGAIRAAIIAQGGGTFDQFQEGNSNNAIRTVAGFVKDKKIPIEGSLSIMDFGLGRKIDQADGSSKICRLYPIPADIAKVKNKDEYFVLSPEKENMNVKINFPSTSLRTLGNKETNNQFLEEAQGFMTKCGLQKYLDGAPLGTDEFLLPGKVFEREYRTGIARNNTTRTSEDGKLYSIEFSRLERGVGFCLEVSGIDGIEEPFKRHKLLRLGGEARSARYETEVTWNGLQLPPILDNRFKLIFLTPSIFENGWVPDGIDPKTLRGRLSGREVILVSAAIRRPLGIGGWDIVKKDSKPMRRAVPAGSVYFFEGTPPKTNSNGYLYLGNNTQQGLGQAILSLWNNKE